MLSKYALIYEEQVSEVKQTTRTGTNVGERIDPEAGEPILAGNDLDTVFGIVDDIFAGLLDGGEDHGGSMVKKEKCISCSWSFIPGPIGTRLDGVKEGILKSRVETLLPVRR